MTKLNKRNIRTKARSNGSENLYKYYLKDVSRIKLLTKEEERELLIKAQAGDMDARNRIVNANQRFIIQVCQKYLNRGIPFEDLISEANIGLMRAIEKYDLTSGNQFLTYAVWWIRQAIMITFSQKNRLIRLPAHRSDQAYKIERFCEAYISKNGKAPSSKEIADQLHLKEDIVKMIMNQVRTPISFDSPIDSSDSDSATLDEMICDRDSQSSESLAEYNNLKSLLNEIMDSDLDEKEKEVLTKRYGLDQKGTRSLNEVGEDLGLTKERVRQIQNSAIRKFQKTSNLVKLKDFA